MDPGTDRGVRQVKSSVPLRDSQKQLCLSEFDTLPCRQESSESSDTEDPTMTEYDEMLVYLPNDDFNIWMLAMIGLGCLFVVFVAVSIYLMCQNSHLNFNENGTQLINISKP